MILTDHKPYLFLGKCQQFCTILISLSTTYVVLYTFDSVKPFLPITADAQSVQRVRACKLNTHKCVIELKAYIGECIS